MTKTSVLAFLLAPHSAEERAAVEWLGKAGPDVLTPLEALLGRLASDAYDEGRRDQLLIEAEHAAADRKAVKP